MKIKFGLIVLLFILVSIGFLFIFKNRLFEYYFNKKIASYSSTYNCYIQCGSVKLNGFSEVNIKQLSIVPLNCDTLLTTEKIDVIIYPFNLLTGKNPIKDIRAMGANINLMNKKNRNNFNWILKIGKTSDKKSIHDTEKNIKKSIHRLFEKIFDFSNESKTLLDNIHLIYQNDSLVYSLQVQKFGLADKNILAIFSENGNSNIWKLSGIINNYESSLSIKVTHNEKNEYIQLLKKFKRINFAFSHAEMQIKYSNDDDDVQLKISGNLHESEIYHAKLSNQIIRLNHFQSDIIAVMDDHKLSLKSVKPAIINQIPFDFTATYTYLPNRKYELKMNSLIVNANTFISSIPTGLLSHFDKLELDGKLRYSLDFMLDDLYPDSCKFVSALVPDNVKINKMGSFDFTIINDDFDHDVIEKGKCIRTIHVGVDNPNYYTLDNISYYLKTAIMNSEDGSFMRHKGFNQSAFRESIAQNYKSGKFSRGGSTITMQLVKNIFLSRNKTISRKLEEALIVWMIENMNLCSKERMYEVYLNIIEFGPNIYGIGEASKFYFNKKPDMLNLSESIFLSSIVPRPKQFKYYFEENLNFKPFVIDKYKAMGEMLKNRKLISETEFNELKPEVELTGPARKHIAPNDSISIDFYEEQKNID